MKTKAKNYQDFPKDINEFVWDLKESTIFVNGIGFFNLSDLKNISLSERLTFPHTIFVAINMAKKEVPK